MDSPKPESLKRQKNMKKLIKKTRGTGAYYEDGTYEFTPQGTGTPVYESVCKLGDSSISRTAGEVSQHFIAKLKCKADAADPAAEMHDLLDKLAAKIWPVTAAPPKPRGKVLLKTDTMTATCNGKTGQIDIHITLNATEQINFQKKIINALTELTQCLYINQPYLLRLSRAIAKHSNQSSTATE